MGGSRPIDYFLKVLIKVFLALDILCTHTSGVVLPGRRLELRIQKLDALQICHILRCLIRYKLGRHSYLICSTCGRLPCDPSAHLPTNRTPRTRTCLGCTGVLRSAYFKLGSAWITFGGRRDANLWWLYTREIENELDHRNAENFGLGWLGDESILRVLTCWFHYFKF